ncbi:FAD-dependent oxidoreductase [Saccharothrix texasensis]|uniref:2,4-dienoyl-CoA reductase-like NADH-dependent reductase (Old Yellow Enzyme family) n=1 Tax=Saccharothrix texasensis TaxID=103734 RepID=A0A3N1GXN1_9PSEU|nr:FAD-dependent oxidoreductase [Saccharothrix texasensis]ROP34987.1 2,4-dienoyl-CoA reductase-like NADH-dependent reductase (Old Yellow Enzyme family) [Saccharothrix texasensis]
MTDYPNLFSPMRIGPKTAKNRIWMTAHSTQLVKDHNFSDAHVHYYAERAKGGVGVITMEAMAVHPTTQPYKGKIFAFDKAVVPNYRKLAAAVREYDCLLLAQPWHRGRETSGQVNRLPVWAPSSVPCAVYREMPHVLTAEEIDELVQGYVLAARYAVEGDLDGVEVHGLAHGYLLGQFLSPATNHRDDEYGGDFDRRLSLVLEIIEKTRAETGRDKIVGVRINGNDGDVPGGLTNEDWTRIARAIADTGLVDYISVTQGTYLERMNIYGATPKPAGFQVEDTARIKAAVPELPIVVAGRMNTPELAEQVLASGGADLIGMARTLIADPEWPNKARDGKANSIRPCVGANWCLASIVNSPLACVHNPAVAREAELGVGTLLPVSVAKRVAVVGGGPAGLRTALTAAQRGHHVTLFEQESELGGQVRLIGRSETYAEWQGITDWLVSQLGETSVDVKLGHRVEAAELLSGYDEVVVATGSTPLKHGWSSLRPASWGDGTIVPGVDQWNVHSIKEVLEGRAEIGPRVMIFDDTGARQPLVAAEYLADRRHAVTLVTRLPQVSPDLEASRDLQSTYRRARNKGIRFITDHELAEVVEDTVVLRDVWTGELVPHEDVDAVVLSTGNRADDALFHALKGSVPVRAVGDCVSPRRVFNAIWEGELAGRDI